MFTLIPLLSSIIWLPIAAGVIMLLADKYVVTSNVLRIFGLLTSLISMLLIICIINNFDLTTWQMQFTEHSAWLPNLGIEYALGVDGFALPLVMLTAFMNFLVLINAKSQIAEQQLIKYSALFLIMQGLMCGVFLALDAVLFYVFFEAMMIPMFLLIGLWGGQNRVYATLKFILYTFFGSLFLLTAIIYLNH